MSDILQRQLNAAYRKGSDDAHKARDIAERMGVLGVIAQSAKIETLVRTRIRDAIECLALPGAVSSYWNSKTNDYEPAFSLDQIKAMRSAAARLALPDSTEEQT